MEDKEVFPEAAMIPLFCIFAFPPIENSFCASTSKRAFFSFINTLIDSFEEISETPLATLSHPLLFI
ncbi:hypothetical protein [Parasutterella excrementihominis]|uniref:hypothetical protein n=1 Tax=Parasutterella excrementihominis TaxID=487175 RepID=UPI00272CB20F|nr:hypothetical protein [Parasutterella excrementihominis]